MNKTISINPDLFTSSNRKSKKRGKKDNSEIKVKPPINEKTKKRQLRKQHILRHLRQHQEQNYKKLMEPDKHKPPIQQSSQEFQSDFKASVDYFKNLSESQPSQKHNYTSKYHHVPNNNNNNNASHVVHSSMEPIIHNEPFDVSSENTVQLSKPVLGNTSVPTWGCLKNGSLPTFRDWKRGTQKVDHNSDITTEKYNKITSMMKAKTEIPQPKLRYRKQKKTIRRTYKVGRSKIFSKIAVLISNKTIRNNIMNKSQQLKQIPITDTRKYLVKHGFIRVGSSAPNDVLRKMYETCKLICGEVENHNSENLLYNYLNDV